MCVNKVFLKIVFVFGNVWEIINRAKRDSKIFNANKSV